MNVFLIDVQCAQAAAADGDLERPGVSDYVPPARSASERDRQRARASATRRRLQRTRRPRTRPRTLRTRTRNTPIRRQNLIRVYGGLAAVLEEAGREPEALELLKNAIAS